MKTIIAFLLLVACVSPAIAQNQTNSANALSVPGAAPTLPPTLSSSDQYKQVVDRAEFFYDKAFAHLLQYILTIVTVAGIVVGVVVPVLNNILQLRALRHSEESLKKTQKDLITEAENRIRAEISGMVGEALAGKLSAHQEKLDKIEAKFKEELAIQKGNIHHVAGKGWSDEKRYGNAAASYAAAACAFLEGDHEVMVKRALVLLSKYTLRHCGPEELKVSGEDLELLKVALEKWSGKDRNEDEIKAFEEAYASAKERKETPKKE